MSFTVFSYNATVLLIQPNPSHVLENATQPKPTQPKPTHGWTQPMSISARLYFLRTDWLQRNWGGWCSVSSCAVTTAPLQCTSTLLELSSVQFMCCEQTFSSDSQDAIILSDNVSSCCISSNTRVTMPRPYAALCNIAICPSVCLSVCPMRLAQKRHISRLWLL